MTNSFKYFPDYQSRARFVTSPCNSCNSTQGPSLDGTWFNLPEETEAICISCLVSGKVPVDVPDYLKIELEDSTRETYPGWLEGQIRDYVAYHVMELSRTPPVPWVQENNWPVHHGDFCRYLGEWNQEQLIQKSPDGNGQAYMMSIIQEPEGIGDPVGLWESIATEWTTLFVFECLTCEQLVGVEQSF